MNDLNYQHLRYFWLVAREGHLTRASQRLHLSPSTVSAQIKQLEAHFGYPLFERRGRGLILTERGETVKEYADEIFALGEEMVDSIRRSTGSRHAYRFRVGIDNHIPKLLAHELLGPALHLEGFPVHLVVREDRPERLVADLAVHHLDLVLVDRAMGLSSDVPAESVLLRESGLTLMASPKLAAKILSGFPKSLEGAPILLPEVGSVSRDLLERWFEQEGIRPRIVAECGDSALIKSLGQEGLGVFVMPTIVRDAVEAQYRVVSVGELAGPVERIYAIVAPSRRGNEAVQAVLDAGVENVRLRQT